MAEEDLILIGVGVTVAGVALYIIWNRLDDLTSAAFTGPGTAAAGALNSAMGGEPNSGNDVAPGSDPNEPENQVGYE